LEEILCAARWAPSGDNAQPWRFEVTGENSVVVHILKEERNVYDYRDGEPTLLSAGTLLESLRIAATAWGRHMDWHHEEPTNSDHWCRIVVAFRPAKATEPDPLYAHLHLRSVDRRPYQWQRLTEAQKAALTEAAGPTLTVTWHESLSERWHLARLSAAATDIRLRAEETFRIHQKVIDWDRAFSPDKMPSGALGLAKSSLPMMRWAMGDWARMQRLNRFIGTGMARLQLDYIPGLASAAYFTMRLTDGHLTTDKRLETLLRAGQSLQRFWLTATRLRLAMQPAAAIGIFAYYGERLLRFPTDPALKRKAGELATAFQHALGGPASDYVFMGRIGIPNPQLPLTRSVRLPLNELQAEGTAEPPR
jgi:nitroreductase